MNTIKNNTALFWFMVILSPLLGAILAPFNAFQTMGVFLGLLFFGLLEIGHKYLGIYSYFYTYYQPQDLKYLLGTVGLSILFTVGFYFQVPQLWMIFFYLIVIHMFWQIDWFYSRLLRGSERSKKLRVLLIISLLFNLIVIHLSPNSLITIYYQKGPAFFESYDFFKWGMLIDSILYFVTIIYFLKLSFQGKEKKSSLFYFIALTFFYRVIYYTPYLGGDPVFVIISSHTLPFVYFLFKDFKRNFKPNNKSILFWFTLIILIVIDYEFLNDEGDLGLSYLKYKPSLMLSLLPGILIGTSLLHFVTSYFLRRRIPIEIYKSE